jgi:hypothetical protein
MPGTISGLIVLVAPGGALRAAFARPGRLGVGRGRKLELGGRVYSVEDPVEVPCAQPAGEG